MKNNDKTKTPIDEQIHKLKTTSLTTKTANLKLNLEKKKEDIANLKNINKIMLGVMLNIMSFILAKPPPRQIYASSLTPATTNT